MPTQVTKSNPLLLPKEVSVTPKALATLTGQDIVRALERHFQGDWGEVDEADQDRNARVMTRGGTIYSAYRSRRNLKFVIRAECLPPKIIVMLDDES